MESLSPAPPPGTRVLCVDDESMIGELITRLLRKHLQCRVSSVRSGKEALARLAEQEFDVVLIDYLMPAMDGGELFTRIRDEMPELVSRILFITGDVLSESTVAAIAATGRPLVEKPFGRDELTGAIQEIVEESRTAI